MADILDVLLHYSVIALCIVEPLHHILQFIARYLQDDAVASSGSDDQTVKAASLSDEPIRVFTMPASLLDSFELGTAPFILQFAGETATASITSTSSQKQLPPVTVTETVTATYPQRTTTVTAKAKTVYTVEWSTYTTTAIVTQTRFIQPPLAIETRSDGRKYYSHESVSGYVWSPTTVTEETTKTLRSSEAASSVAHHATLNVSDAGIPTSTDIAPTVVADTVHGTHTATWEYPTLTGPTGTGLTHGSATAWGQIDMSWREAVMWIVTYHIFAIVVGPKFLRGCRWVLFKLGEMVVDRWDDEFGEDDATE
ncbi:hypothetical protein BJ508DRAFT_331080 [Ascobolus immersus RN42]|uniref:Uncharacterized protein n=1 Tax=Ascobolus immersus RN42 TaxID=1160509 RepID=A0A3N4HVG8_ASCIM|nr:hypothetical protein BJ508DRAFT_331080 [Ascobolus immersus RN42]